jgi:hypothetical protein
MFLDQFLQLKNTFRNSFKYAVTTTNNNFTISLKLLSQRLNHAHKETSTSLLNFTALKVLKDKHLPRTLLISILSSMQDLWMILSSSLPRNTPSPAFPITVTTNHLNFVKVSLLLTKKIETAAHSQNGLSYSALKPVLTANRSSLS